MSSSTFVESPKEFLGSLPKELLGLIFDVLDLNAYPAVNLTCSRFTLFMQPYFQQMKNNGWKFSDVENETSSYTKPDYIPIKDQNGMNIYFRSVFINNENIVKLFNYISVQPRSALALLLLRRMQLKLGTNNFLKEIIYYTNLKTFLELVKLLELSGFTLEHYYSAIQSGNVEIVQYFIDNGSPVNHNRIIEGLSYGQSPLSVAIKWNQTECAKLLLSKGASLDDPCAYEKKHGIMVYPTYYLIDILELTPEMEQVLQMTRQQLEAKKHQWYSDNKDDIEMITNPCSVM